MSITSRRRVRVSAIPEDVAQILAVSQSEVSTNDYVVGVLSRRYGLEWNPTGKQGQREVIGTTIIVKLPEPLWVELKKEAVPYSTMSDVVIKAIQEDS